MIVKLLNNAKMYREGRGVHKFKGNFGKFWGTWTGNLGDFPKVPQNLYLYFYSRAASINKPVKIQYLIITYMLTLMAINVY